MRTLKSVSLLMVLVLARAATANAQMCLGLPSFTSGSVHANVAGQFPDSASGFAVGIGAGRPNSLFANIGLGQLSQDGIDGKHNYGFLEFGYQFPVNMIPGAQAQVCPIAGGLYGQGPDDDVNNIKVTSYSALFGVAGGVAVGTKQFSVVPNASLRYEFGSDKYDYGTPPNDTFNFSGGSLDLGLGLVFLDRFSIQPLIQIPFAQDTGDPELDEAGSKISFGIFAAFSFGWRAQ
jgi:hypothetical protein